MATYIFRVVYVVKGFRQIERTGWKLRGEGQSIGGSGIHLAENDPGNRLVLEGYCSRHPESGTPDAILISSLEGRWWKLEIEGSEQAGGLVPTVSLVVGDLLPTAAWAQPESQWVIRFCTPS